MIAALKELIIEIGLGITSPSKTMVPSCAHTKIGRRFYTREYCKFVRYWAWCWQLRVMQDALDLDSTK